MEINIAGGSNGAARGYNYYNDILKFDTTTQTWLKVGQLTKVRTWHAMSIVPIDQVKNYCV